ncbi:MAG: hypothetical protein RL260_2806 [Pseudomonadota bacterium]|jgi:hypothetical protein
MTPEDLQIFVIGAIFGACLCGFAWWSAVACELVSRLCLLLRRGAR